MSNYPQGSNRFAPWDDPSDDEFTEYVPDDDVLGEFICDRIDEIVTILNKNHLVTLNEIVDRYKNLYEEQIRAEINNGK